MTNFRVIIAGNRDFNDYDLLETKCDEILVNKLPNVTILSGAALGADALGECYATQRKLHLDMYHANWSLGKKAGHIRNELMAQNADALILFWDGLIRGTIGRGSKNMMETAERYGLKIRWIKT